MIYCIRQDYPKLQQAGVLARQALTMVASLAVEGSCGIELDDAFAKFVSQNSCRAACLGFHGYPKHLCVSVNEQICHGIPSSKPFQFGDLVSIDLVVELNGYFADTCTTVLIEKQIQGHEQRDVLAKQRALLHVTQQALAIAIKEVRPNMLTSDIGRIIQANVPDGYSIVKEYCGHGIGKSLHHAPQILHYFNPQQQRIKLKPGMCFTIEPMICDGSADCTILDDGWTVVTRDGSMCAQFEHTLFMMDDGLHVLT